MDIKSFVTSLDAPARTRLFIGVGAIVLLAAGLLWWAWQPREQLLFGNLREADAAEIVKSLDEWKVPYTIVDGGAGITVAEDRVYDTRMKLVSAGVPRGGHVGFELFDDADFGVTEFAQRVNYQRALQGEIERTIASMPGVETARVHLTIRRPGLFVGETEASKASVALTLHQGEVLSRQQINGIRNLVASSVEGLSVNQVSVLDSDGALLAGTSQAAAGAIGLDERGDEEARTEARIQARVSELLGQVLTDEEFRVSVDVSLNFDAVREVNERPIAQGDDGNGLVARRRVNTVSGAEGSGRNDNQEESEFVHGTERREISRAPGGIERISVAVVLPPTLDELQVTRIHALVAAAAGIKPERGDLIEVVRLGRNQRWVSPNELSSSAPVPVQPGHDLAPVTVRGEASVPAWRKWALIGAGVALLLIIAMTAGRRRPRALKPEEREAVLAKLRGWLADGTSLP